MGKSNVIKLNPDMTFQEKKIKTQGVSLPMDKDWTPDFSPGKSVFSEVDMPKWKFWKRQRKLIILEDEAEHAYELEPKGNPHGKAKLKPRHWTRKEEKKFLSKVIAKSKAQQKPFTNWQVFAILIGLGIVVVLQLMIMKGVRLV